MELVHAALGEEMTGDAPGPLLSRRRTACRQGPGRYDHPMHVRGVDPRDTTWEQDAATYRAYFWDRSANTSDDYEVTGADVEEVLAWARAKAEETGSAYTLYVRVTDEGKPGLVRLSGVAGDPFA